MRLQLYNYGKRVLQRCCHSQASEQKLKVLFFGTDDFSVPTLKALHTECQKINGCISAVESCCIPMKSLTSPVKKACDELSIKIHYWPPPLEVCQKFDLGVVSSFGYLIPSKIINSFPKGILNVHGSLLPKYRGAAPIPFAILNGDKTTGITIMEVKPFHFDIGSILANEECEIKPHEKRSQLAAKMSHIGADLMLRVIQDYPIFEAKKRPQPEEGVSHSPKITKDMFEILWNEKTAQQVYNQWRALGETSNLFSYFSKTNALVKLEDISLPSAEIQEHLDRINSANPGQIVSLKKKGIGRFIGVKCVDGWICFQKFSNAGKKYMGVTDFHNGFIARFKNESQYFVSSREIKTS